MNHRTGHAGSVSGSDCSARTSLISCSEAMNFPRLTPGISGAHERLMMRGVLFARPLHAVYRRGSAGKNHQFTTGGDDETAPRFGKAIRPHFAWPVVTNHCRFLLRIIVSLLELGLTAEMCCLSP